MKRNTVVTFTGLENHQSYLAVELLTRRTLAVNIPTVSSSPLRLLPSDPDPMDRIRSLK
jgi:hypothetical protein